MLTRVGVDFRKSEARMIFRKEPLLDAEWLLGPTDPQPRPFIRKDICAVILIATIAIVAGWTQVSNLVLAAQRPKQLLTNDSNATSCFGLPDRPSLSGSEATKIDESLIRTVDRFVPHTRTNTANSSASQNLTNNIAIKTVALATTLPNANLNSAVESHFAVADLRTDANLIIPLDLLATRMPKSDDQLTFQNDSDSLDLDDRSFQSSEDLLQSNKPTRVVRTVSYTGDLLKDDRLAATPAEPARLKNNVLRLPESVVSEEKMAESDAISNNESQLPGLEKRATGEVVRLLGSVQPRLAGAALNELKRRGFDDAHLQLAVDLVSGRTEARIAALDRLIAEQSFAPLTWLVWMAEDEDRRIREHAIRLLSTMPGEDVRMEIRLLMNREKDAALSDLLRKASFSSGALLTNHEKKR